jgi:hypothetical protein
VHLSVPQMRRKRKLLVAAALAATAATAVALGATTPTPVKTTAKNEVGPAAGDDWFVWSRSRERQPSPFDLFAQRTGNRAFRVNKKGTQAYAGGIDGTTLVYQVIRGQLATGSDLRLFDLATRRHKPLPRGIDTNNWECCGTISGDWLLFGRGRAYGSGTQLVLLRNLVTGEQRVLDTLRNRKGLLGAGQLNGTFAVWTRCNPYPFCQIFRYDLATASATALPVATGKIPYAPAVNESGTAYYMQSNRGCGKSVELIKKRVTGGPELLASLPQGRDVDVAYAHTFLPKPPREVVTTSIYFDVITCRTKKWDIYRVDDTERPLP